MAIGECCCAVGVQIKRKGHKCLRKFANADADLEAEINQSKLTVVNAALTRRRKESEKGDSFNDKRR